MIFHPGRSHRGWKPCGRYLLAPLTRNKEGSKGLIVLRVKPTPSRFPINSLYIPLGNTLLQSIPNVWRQRGCCCCWPTVQKSARLYHVISEHAQPNIRIITLILVHRLVYPGGSHGCCYRGLTTTWTENNCWSWVGLFNVCPKAIICYSHHLLLTSQQMAKQL